MAINFTFQEEHFNRIFPFYILIDQQLTVKSTGNTLKKIIEGTTEKKFTHNFKIKRPELKVTDFESLKSMKGQLLIIECLNEKKNHPKRTNRFFTRNRPASVHGIALVRFPGRSN